MAKVILGSRPAKVLEQSGVLSCISHREECANSLAFQSLLPHSLELFLEFLLLPEPDTQASYIEFYIAWVLIL